MSYVLGIASNGTDSAACLFENNKLICAVEEERFSRIRHDGSFPRNAIRWCLEFGGMEQSDIHSIAISWDYTRYTLEVGEELSIRGFYRLLNLEGYPIDWKAVEFHIDKFQPESIIGNLKKEFSELSSAPIYFYCHHDCHAVSSYCFSGFDNSLVLVMDEKGEDICTSLYLGEGNSLRILEQYKIPHSLGLFYAAATQFLSFTPFQDEGTFMALATNGSIHSKLRSWLLESVFRDSHVGIILNPEMISKEVFGYPRPKGFFYTDKMLKKLSGFGIYRPQERESIQPIHRDFAHTIQDVLESVILKFLATSTKKTKVKRLCIAGGVGLNCALNSKIMQSYSIESGIHEMFLPPWCHDAGGAIGAAILAIGGREKDNTVLNLPKFDRISRADWGPSYSNNSIKQTLKSKRLVYFCSTNVERETSKYLADGKIVAWFQGRAELGPRALGQRSLLSSPQHAGNKKRLQDIKLRLTFRPFAPSILEEYSFKYFNKLGSNTDFMTTAFQATDLAHQEIGEALNLMNGTLRPQTVSKRKGWRYRKLLEEFYSLTGIPALLNTSFNIKEPTVLTPDNAVSTFLDGNIDVLVMENFIVRNPLKTNKNNI